VGAVAPQRFVGAVVRAKHCCCTCRCITIGDVSTEFRAAVHVGAHCRGEGIFSL
jgi:hypothetical protein